MRAFAFSMDTKSYALGLAKLIVIAMYDIAKTDGRGIDLPLRALVLHPAHWADLCYECPLEDFWASNEDMLGNVRRWRGIRVILSATDEAHFVTRSGRRVYL